MGRIGEVLRQGLRVCYTCVSLITFLSQSPPKSPQQPKTYTAYVPQDIQPQADSEKGGDSGVSGQLDDAVKYDGNHAASACS